MKEEKRHLPSAPPRPTPSRHGAGGGAGGLCLLFPPHPQPHKPREQMQTSGGQARRAAFNPPAILKLQRGACLWAGFWVVDQFPGISRQIGVRFGLDLRESPHGSSQPSHSGICLPCTDPRAL